MPQQKHPQLFLLSGLLEGIGTLLSACACRCVRSWLKPMEKIQLRTEAQLEKGGAL